MPASVVINQQSEILQFRGATDLYISPSTGKATFNILKMTRPEIAFELRTAIPKAIKTRQSVRKSGIELKLKDAKRLVGIEVVPLKLDWDEPLLLILFSEQEPGDALHSTASGSKHSSSARDRKIKKLEETAGSG
jgi:two-component system CheB/CheR fusion protein